MLDTYADHTNGSIVHAHFVYDCAIASPIDMKPSVCSAIWVGSLSERAINAYRSAGIHRNDLVNCVDHLKSSSRALPQGYMSPNGTDRGMIKPDNELHLLEFYIG